MFDDGFKITKYIYEFDVHFHRFLQTLDEHLIFSYVFGAIELQTPWNQGLYSFRVSDNTNGPCTFFIFGTVKMKSPKISVSLPMIFLGCCCVAIYINQLSTINYFRFLGKDKIRWFISMEVSEKCVHILIP